MVSMVGFVIENAPGTSSDGQTNATSDFILVGTRDSWTQFARAFFFSFTWMVLTLPYILYYFQEFKQQSNSIVLGNYLYSSHTYSSQTIVKWVARIDGGI